MGYTLHHIVGLGVLVLLLTACGGSSLQVANGIGGTGFTKGRITAFGSIYVDGVKYNTDNAIFIRDGRSSKQQSDFSTGEIVKVIGHINADNTTGIANKVIFSDVLEGFVSKLANKNTIEILGQTVISNKETIFHGFQNLSELKLGNILEVSGYHNTNGKITATSIKYIQDHFTEGDTLNLEGTISKLDTEAKNFILNNKLKISYSSSQFINFNENDIENDLYLYISTEQNLKNGILIASEIELVEDTLEANTEYRLESFITRYVSPEDFDIDGYPAKIDDQTLYKLGTKTDLKLNTRILVIGVTDDQGEILLDEISVFNESNIISIEAQIEDIDYDAQTFTLFGKNIALNYSTLLTDDLSDSDDHISFSEFDLGEMVFVNFYQDNKGAYIATRLSKTKYYDTLYLSAVAKDIQVEEKTLSVFNQSIITDKNTLYFDANDNEISSETFFSNIIAEEKIVDLTGNFIGNDVILAEELWTSIN